MFIPHFFLNDPELRRRTHCTIFCTRFHFLINVWSKPCFGFGYVLNCFPETAVQTIEKYFVANWVVDVHNDKLLRKGSWRAKYAITLAWWFLRVSIHSRAFRNGAGPPSGLCLKICAQSISDLDLAQTWHSKLLM